MRLVRNVNSSNGKAGTRMKDRILNDWWLKLLSVIIAIALWAVVVSIDDPTITRSFTQVPVELTNTNYLTDKGDYFEVADNSDIITVIATGKRSIIDSLSRDNFRAVADFGKINDNLVPIEVRATKFADRLDSVTMRTSNVKLDIEGLLERQVPVTVKTEGNVSEGCILGNVTVDRSVVKISGPESVVEEIESADVTVDITGVSSDISTVCDIELVDESGDEVLDERIKTNISTVNVKVEVWGSKEVPLVYGYSGTPMAGFGLTGETYIAPSSIKIAADKEKLNSISELTIPSTAVDITGAMSDMDIPVNVADYLPSGVALFGEEEAIVIVHVGVSALLSKNVQINTANIALINIPEGMSAKIAEPNEFIVAIASGIGNGFINLDETSITGVADLSVVELTESEDQADSIYDVPVALEYPSGIYSGGDVTIKVLLSKAEEADGEGAESAESSTEH